MEWAGVVQEATAQSQGLVDVVVDSGHLHLVNRPSTPLPAVRQRSLFDPVEAPAVVPDLAMIYGPQVFELTPWALRQMCARLEVPAEYVLRCPPDVQAFNLNHWQQKEQGQWLLRCRAGVVRGVLSPRYTPFGHGQVLEAVAAGLGAAPVAVLRAHLDDELLHLVLGLPLPDPGAETDPDPTGPLPTLCVVNSEVGCRPVTVALGVWWTGAGGGLMGPPDHRMSRIHQGIDARELRAEIGAEVAEALARAQSMRARLVAARHTTLADPERAIRQAGNRVRMPAQDVAAAHSAFAAEPAATQYAVLRAFALAARQLPPDRRLDMEQLAGRLLEPATQPDAE